MNDSQTIFTLLRAILELRIAGCKECKESGTVINKPDFIRGALKPLPYTCPTCAKDRAMLEVVCWHSCEKGLVDKRYIPDEIYYCDHCGEGPRTFKDDWCNPDLTTARSESGTQLLIVEYLDRMGLWEEFEHWMWVKHGGQPVKTYLDGALLVPAIKSWLEGRVKG